MRSPWLLLLVGAAGSCGTPASDDDPVARAQSSAKVPPGDVDLECPGGVKVYVTGESAPSCDAVAAVAHDAVQSAKGAATSSASDDCQLYTYTIITGPNRCDGSCFSAPPGGGPVRETPWQWHVTYACAECFGHTVCGELARVQECNTDWDNPNPALSAYLCTAHCGGLCDSPGSTVCLSESSGMNCVADACVSVGGFTYSTWSLFECQLPAVCSSNGICE